MDLKKIILPAVGVIVGISAAIMVYLLTQAPPEGKAPHEIERPVEAKPEELPTSHLKFQEFEKRLKAVEDNMGKLYNNQVELTRTITELSRANDATTKTQKENRAYIAMLYQKVLDIELKTENLGGGFSTSPKKRREREEVNPLSGTEADLPGVLPLLPAEPPTP